MNTHQTHNLALAAYLAQYGLKYSHFEVKPGKHGKTQVFFFFEDDAGIGKELEREFIGSRERKYRDFLYFFRNEVDAALNQKP